MRAAYIIAFTTCLILHCGGPFAARCGAFDWEPVEIAERLDLRQKRVKALQAHIVSSRRKAPDHDAYFNDSESRREAQCKLFEVTYVPRESVAKTHTRPHPDHHYDYCGSQSTSQLIAYWPPASENDIDFIECHIDGRWERYHPNARSPGPRLYITDSPESPPILSSLSLQLPDLPVSDAPREFGDLVRSAEHQGRLSSIDELRGDDGVELLILTLVYPRKGVYIDVPWLNASACSWIWVEISCLARSFMTSVVRWMGNLSC